MELLCRKNFFFRFQVQTNAQPNIFPCVFYTLKKGSRIRIIAIYKNKILFYNHFKLTKNILKNHISLLQKVVLLHFKKIKDI